MEMLKRFKKPTFVSTKDKVKELLEVKYSAVVRKTQERINESVQLNTCLEELIGKERDLLKEKANLETTIAVLKERKSFLELDAKESRANILNIKKEKAVINERIEMLLKKKKQAEIDKENAHTEVIKTHEAFLKAHMHYKKKLQIRVELDNEENIKLQFLKICTPDGARCYVKLSRKDNKWRLLELVPHLTCEEELAKHLEETQDIQGFVEHVRKLFMTKVQSAK